MCVQPMKAIAAVALASKMPLPQIVAAGFIVSCVVLLLTITRTLPFINRLLPLPIIRGIQLGTGLNLVNKGVQTLLSSSGFKLGEKGFKSWTDNFVIALLAFVAGISFYRSKRNPTALVLFGYGILVGLVMVLGVNGGRDYVQRGVVLGPEFPSILPVVPTLEDFKVAFLAAALGQIPLTLLNSVIAVSKLADDLYPEKPKPVASVMKVGFGVGMLNIVGMWFGSLPWCHGVSISIYPHRFHCFEAKSIVAFES
jgi:MFS superfamily sulfate permease-like transporter